MRRCCCGSTGAGSLPAGSLLAVYVAGYGVGRFWVEGLRIDPANEIAGLRLNQWMAILAIIGGVAYTVWAIRRDGVTRQPDASRHVCVRRMTGCESSG